MAELIGAEFARSFVPRPLKRACPECVIMCDMEGGENSYAQGGVRRLGREAKRPNPSPLGGAAPRIRAEREQQPSKLSQTAANNALPLTLPDLGRYPHA